jgi:hypothetical protein
MGSWLNILTFVADDQDGSGGPFEQVHLISADSLSRIVSKNNPEYTIQKIYMDAYTQETTPGGERYPEGEIAIKNRINAGSLIVTYVGHGGERGWAHERILDIPTIQGFDNLYQMPVFLTATCELARYDDPNYKSAGELLVLNPNGGAIAIGHPLGMSGARLALAVVHSSLRGCAVSNLSVLECTDSCTARTPPASTFTLCLSIPPQGRR